MSSDLSVAEVAKILSVHYVTVHRWITDGTLPAYRIGARTIRIRPEDVEAVRSKSVHA